MAINFSCPHCGKQTVVADQFAGQSGACANCGAQITIPLGFGQTGPTHAPKSGGGSAMFVILAIFAGCLLFCCGGVTILFFLGRSQVLVSQQRMISQNNLKQIGLALHNYHDTYGKFPPAVVHDANGKPLYSGRVLLLPFLEQSNIYQQWDKSKAWDAPENMALAQVPMPVFHDPANKRGAPQRSDYMFVTGTGTMFDGTKSARIGDVTDGTSNTMMVVGTKAGPANWAEPVEWNIDAGVVPTGNQPEKIQVLFGDGSVRVMRTQYFGENMRALSSKGGGEVLPDEFED